MRIPSIARIAGVVLVASSLAACMDMELTIEPLTADSGRSTTSQAMDRSMYDAFVAPDPSASAEFCTDGVFELTDTAAICTVTEEGTYAELFGTDDPTAPQVTVLPNNQVRIEAATAGLTEEIQNGMGGEDTDPQQMEMILSLFEGKFLTLRYIGNIIETNGEVAEDGQSAYLAIPFVELLQGTAVLPDSFYAVIQLP